MTKGYVEAVDVGYGNVKAIGDSEMRPEGMMVGFPSYIGPYTPTRCATGMEDAQLLSRLAIAYRDKRYYAGEAALTQRVAQATIEEGRAWSEEGMVLLMAALSLLVEYDQQLVNLVLGLPISDFNAASKEAYRNAVIGKHDISRLNRDGSVEFHSLVNVADARVMPQPFGAMFNYLLDAAGNLVSEVKAAGEIGIVDVGFNTLDLAWSSNLTLVDNRSESFARTGMFTVAETLAQLISADHHIPYPVEDASQALNKGFITIKGKPVDLNPYKGMAYEISAQKIVTRIKNKWPDMWRLNTLILSGGGAHFLGPMLADMLQMGEALTISINPWWDNVLGFYKFGKRIKSWK